MRFMIMVRATADSEAGRMPEESLLAAMVNYHEALSKAGVLLDANGLLPSSRAGASSTTPRANARCWTAPSPKPRS